MGTEEEHERAALIALLRRGDRSWAAVADLVEAAGSALTVLSEPVPGQGRLFGDDPAAELRAAGAEVDGWRRDGIDIVTLLDYDYPANLLTIHQRPPVLFLRGHRHPAEERAVAVVGTRSPSAEGLRQADEVAGGLARRGVVVVSGLAAGIDTAAHLSALRNGGRTVAVIGTGLHRAYPAANASLQDRIAREGLVISQFWPDAPPTKHSFPMRNAVMSGYSLATVVIEANYRSGARMQARLALEHGRHVFLMRSLLAHDWARSYAERPGTSVVDSAAEVLADLERLAAEPRELVWA